MGKLLPENWVETELDKVAFAIKGKKPKRLEEFSFEDSLPYMDIRALEFGEIRQYADNKSSNIFQNNDIAIVWDGARSGWVAKSTIGAIGSTIAALRPIGIQSDYLYYYLLNQYPFINSSLRGVGIPHVDPTILWNLEFPLPPLPEQQRIADKLNILFKQLEIIRKATDNIPQLLKNFRQQILNNALSGKLIDGVSEKKILKEFLSDVKYGTSRKADYDNDGIPTFRIPNIVNGGIDDKDMKFVKLPEKEYEQLKLRERDILIIRSNGSVSLVGKSAIVQKKFEKYVYAGYLIRLRCKTQLDPEFLNYSLNSDFCRNQIVEFAHSMNGINNINADQIRNLYILIYPLEIQQKIVEKIKCLFAKSDIIEQGYIRLKQKIDKLPQAILHKAFKGELVEQLPTDGSALDLLREIEQLREKLQRK